MLMKLALYRRLALPKFLPNMSGGEIAWGRTHPLWFRQQTGRRWAPVLCLWGGLKFQRWPWLAVWKCPFPRPHSSFPVLTSEEDLHRLFFWFFPPCLFHLAHSHHRVMYLRDAVFILRSAISKGPFHRYLSVLSFSPFLTNRLSENLHMASGKR